MTSSTKTRDLETQRDNAEDFGGGDISAAGEASLVQGLGRPRTVEEIGQITIEATRGVPILR